ncbi:MAG: phosphoenolpyruvate--protein phosphotransferase [Mariprofundus sp.]|nr:phosphoenolpyruvate--protein phosphotransferase [Mariprofundus sp.]
MSLTQAPRLRREGSCVASSSGIVIGCVQKVLHGQQPIPAVDIEHDQIEQEVSRLLVAIEAAIADIDVEREHLNQAGAKDPLMILDAHRMLIVDPELLDKSVGRINKDCINAEWALRQEMDAVQVIFEQVEDEYLRHRKHDIEHAGRRILKHLMRSSGGGLQEQLAQRVNSNRANLGASPRYRKTEQQIIYIADDFSVTDIVSMWRHGVAGVITEQGGADAHAVIVARGVALPMLIGAAGILSQVEDGDTLILDAERGIWLLNPPANEQAAYLKFMDAIEISKKSLQVFAGKPSLSADGHVMKLMANVEFPEELDIAESIGIDGIGLYRSEFLFINESKMPNEDFQYRQYAELVKRMDGKPVTMRLLDVGGDRPWLYEDLAGHVYGGANPAMGLRGIRLLLRNPQLMKTQLSAMLRAAEHGPVQILVPMVTECREMELVRDALDDCRKALGMTQDVPLGAMIEVPAAALMAKDMAKVCDFFSIGSNDLMQYALAADRNDEELAELYQAGEAAVLQLIVLATTAAKKASIPISVCGELAANPEWTATFLNLDMDFLSMSLNNILPVRQFLSRETYHPLSR